MRQRTLKHADLKTAAPRCWRMIEQHVRVERRLVGSTAGPIRRALHHLDTEIIFSDAHASTKYFRLRVGYARIVKQLRRDGRLDQ